jgi:hypothetical protein
VEGLAAGDGDAFHHAAGGEIIAGGEMLGGAIVPEGDAARLPAEAALAFGVAGRGVEMRQQALALQRAEALDMAGEAAVDEQAALLDQAAASLNDLFAKWQAGEIGEETPDAEAATDSDLYWLDVTWMPAASRRAAWRCMVMTSTRVPVACLASSTETVWPEITSPYSSTASATSRTLAMTWLVIWMRDWRPVTTVEAPTSPMVSVKSGLPGIFLLPFVARVRAGYA